MMTERMFCIRCGRDAVEGTVFCADCLSSGAPLASAPDLIAFQLCPSCGKVKRGGSWVLPGDFGAHIRSEIRRAVTVSGDASLAGFEISGLHPEENSSDAVLTLSVLTHGVHKEEQLRMRVRVESSTCPTCSRRSGHYFESTIQIRSLGAERAEVIDRVLSYVLKLCEGYEKTEKGFFVSSVKKTKGGVDVALSSNTVGAAVAKKAANAFGSELVSTRKLFGRKNGKEIYRTTFLVRAAMFNPGDYVELEGSYYRVSKSASIIVLAPVSGGETVRMTPSQSEKLRYMGGRELEDWAEVISEDEGSVKVIDPRTLDEVTVRTSVSVPRGSRIRVIHADEGLVEVTR